MTDFPKWFYWLYELPGPDGYSRRINSQEIPESDIRHEKNDLDVPKWCTSTNVYWDARQAALISFARDPELVGPDSEIIELKQWKTADREKHFQFWEAINNVLRAINVAQSEGELPEDGIHREKYLKWAIEKGISIPPLIFAVTEYARASDLLEKSLRQLSDRPGLRDALTGRNFDQHLPASLPSDAAGLVDTINENELRKRERNSFYMTIYALLLKAKLVESVTAKDLAGLLKEEFDKSGKYVDDVSYPGYQTILKQLNEMMALVKRNEKK
jgi:hypothetical protein